MIINTNFTKNICNLLLITCAWISTSYFAKAQINTSIEMPVSISENPSTPDNSSLLDLQSTSKGVLVPRMTSAERNNIANPATGLLVYDTTTFNFWFHNGIAWRELGAAPPVAASPTTFIEDADGDTRIDTEYLMDEDKIRFYINDIEGIRYVQNSDNSVGIQFPNNSKNVFIGNGAGQSSAYDGTTSGSDFNTFIGFNSGWLTSTGRLNTAVGFRAGSKIDGNLNVYMGTNAGTQQTAGVGNAFVGASSGAHISNGDFNAYFGTNTAANVATCSRNTAIGSSAGRDGGDLNENVYVGYQAGELNLNGHGNVFLGAFAGRNTQNMEDILMIENSTTLTPLIYGDFLNDMLGVNWDSSVALPNTLSVNGDASKTTAGDWLANSDARLKKNINNLDSKLMLKKLLSMRGVSYEWNDSITGFKRPEGVQYGFIAQDVQDVWPSNVIEDKQGYLMTGYGTYDHMYVEAIKALHEENEALKKELSEINNVLDKIVAKVEKMSSDGTASN